MTERGVIDRGAGAPAITVVVPARDAEGTIADTLRGITGQAVPGGFEVIVVDNGSRDRTAAIAGARGAAVIGRPRGAGPAAARNAGAAAGRGRALAFTDADCEPAPGWLAAGLRALEDAEIVQGRVLPAADVGPFDRTLGVNDASGLFETANLFVCREMFERIGGFAELPDGPEPERPPFGEDAWFGWRARRAGARAIFCPEALVRHAVFPRRAREFVAEHARRRHFPALVRRIPELRETFLHRRLFLNSRTAVYDAALLGVLAAAGRRSPLPLFAALPYAVRVYRDAERWGRRRRRVALAEMMADAVTVAALIRGSIEARTPVL